MHTTGRDSAHHCLTTKGAKEVTKPFEMYELIGKPGKNWHIVQWDRRLGSVPVAIVRDEPEELERARRLVAAANSRYESGLIKQGQREAEDPRTSANLHPYDPVEGDW